MSTKPPKESWWTQLPNLWKAAIGAVTTLVGFILLARNNFHAVAIASVVVALGSLVYVCVYVLSEKIKDPSGKPTKLPRYTRYHALAYSGIGICFLVVMSSLVLPSGRKFIAIAMVGTPTPTVTSTPIPTETPSPTATSTPFAPGAADETLIVIARFYNTTEVSPEPEVKIRRRIEEELEALAEGNVRVEVEPTILNADDSEDAEVLGKLHQASIIIWGEDTGVEMIVHYLNLRQPDFDAAKAKIVERDAVYNANPDAHAHFITEDLPGQITFLALFAVAQSYFVNEEYYRAAMVLERAIDVTSDDAMSLDLASAYFRLGWLYQQDEINELTRAIANYDQAIRLNPNDATYYNNRATTYTHLRELERAIEDHNTAIDIDPDYAAAYNNRGIAYYYRGELELAIEDFDKAIDLNSKDDLAHNNRANVYIALQEYERAIEDYDQSIALNPNYADAYNNRGIAYYRLRKLDESIESFSKAIAINPDYQDAYYNRGVAYSYQKEWARAIEDYSKVIDLNPEYVAAYINRGNTYNHLSDFEKAIADFDEAIALDPTIALTYINRGEAYVALGNRERAIEDYERAVVLAPKRAGTKNFLCWNYGLLQLPEKALPHCNQAIELVAAPSYYDSRGLVYALLEQFDAAIADFQVYISYLEEQNDSGMMGILEKRKGWVESLQIGVNPFTSEVLDELREE